MPDTNKDDDDDENCEFFLLRVVNALAQWVLLGIL